MSNRKTIFTFVACLFLAAAPAPHAALTEFEQIPLATFEKMRDIERHQLKISEKHYTNGEFQTALAEYEKFLTLYQDSPGAPYAQLMWSHTMMHLKKPKTALREGFQSVIDYWPESAEATVAAYCMADAYRTMGEVKSAQAAFRMLIKEYPEHPIAVRSRQALLHYARVQQDQPERLALLNDLTYQVKRTEAAKQACVDASIELAELHFFAQRFDQGEQALATTHAPPQLFTEVYNLSAKTVAHLLANPDTRAAAEKLADQLLGALRDEADAHPDLAKGLLYRAADLNTSLTRHSETWKLYEEIATRFGRDDPLLTQMATWLKQRGKRDEAREIYARFSDPVAGTKHLAAMLIEEDKPTEAIGVFRKLIEIDGQHAGEHLWSIAACYEKLSDWKKALAIYQQVERFPDDHFRMAACHRKLGNHNEAIVLYKQCKLSDESAPEATLQIAFTYEEANDKQQAIRTFQLTCKRYPKAEQASRAHAHLQNQYNINVTLGGSE